MCMMAEQTCHEWDAETQRWVLHFAEICETLYLRDGYCNACGMGLKWDGTTRPMVEAVPPSHWQRAVEWLAGELAAMSDRFIAYILTHEADMSIEDAVALRLRSALAEDSGYWSRAALAATAAEPGEPSAEEYDPDETPIPRTWGQVRKEATDAT